MVEDPEVDSAVAEDGVLKGEEVCAGSDFGETRNGS